MSVYTTVERDDLIAFLESYDIGELIEYRGIEGGVENSNYLVTTIHQRYILTLFEQLTNDEIPPFFELLSFLNHRGVPCVPPIRSNNDLTLRSLCEKPAALFPFREGSSPSDPNLKQLEQLGRGLAQLHIACGSSPRSIKGAPHDYAIKGVQKILSGLGANDQAMYTRTNETLKKLKRTELPQGFIHGDLFRDNSLFKGNQLTAILDFYSGSTDALLLDLAICATDWCRNKDNTLNHQKSNALLSAYQARRPLNPDELKAWPDMLIFAAFRFWCSRLVDKTRVTEQALGSQKDPGEYKQLLNSLVG